MEKQPHKNIIVCPRPLYSLVLALCDLWLFLKIKRIMKSKHFGSTQDTEAARTGQLKTQKTAELLQKAARMMGHMCSKQGVGVLKGSDGNLSFTIITF